MEDMVVLQLRAAVLASDLERLRGIGMPLDLAVALLSRCLEARPDADDRDVLDGSTRRPTPPRPWRSWAGAGCADEG